MKNSMKVFILLTLFLQLNANTKKQYIAIGESITMAETYTVPSKGMYELSLKYGYMLNRYFGVEARGVFQLAQHKELTHKYSYGLYLKPNIEISKNTNIYGLIGYSKNKLVKNETNFINNETIQYDLSYGGGIEHEYAKNKYVYIDFVQYIDKSTTQPEGKYAIKINSVSMGLKYNFSF